MPDVHLRYGGSSMHRTVVCTDWRALADKLPPPKANPAADRGSCLHDLVEICVNEDKPAEEWLDYHSDKWDYTVTQDDVIALNTALTAFWQLMDDLGLDEWVTEEFVQISKLVGGSADVIACGRNNAGVIDWKFGYQPVDATKSWQGATYINSAKVTKSVADMLEGKALHFAIIQPAASPAPSVYQYRAQDLIDMGNEINEAVALSEEGKGTLAPGSHCQFCPGAPVCDAKLLQAEQAVTLPKDLTLCLEDALLLATELEPWIKQVKNFAHEMLEQGAEVPGWKLVDKRATRKWRDTEKVTVKVKAMRRLKQEDWAKIELKTAPQIEAVCKAKKIDFDKEFGPLIEKVSSGTTLAPETDKRPAVKQISQGDVAAALASIETSAGIPD